MIHECRLKAIKKHHAFGALLVVVMLYLLNYFDVAKIEHWSSYAIGMTVTLGFLYLVGNSKVSVEINEDSVIVYHSGMVQANIPKESISLVSVEGQKNQSVILISTRDGLKYSVPLACFSDAEVTAIERDLRKA